MVLKRILFGLLLFSPSLALPLHGEPTPPGPTLDAKSMEVLATASGFYAGLTSFQADGTVVLQSKFPPNATKQDLNESFTLAVARPASFALSKQNGMMGGTLVSNGKTTFAYLENFAQKEFITLPAPTELAQLFSSSNVELFGRILVNTALYQALVAKYPFGPLVSGRYIVSYVGAEKIGETPADHIRLISPNTTMGASVDLWFFSGPSPVLLQGKWETTPFNILFTFSNWRINETIPPTRFEFQPPADAVSVSRFSMPERKETAPPWVPKAPTP